MRPQFSHLTYMVDWTVAGGGSNRLGGRRAAIALGPSISRPRIAGRDSRVFRLGLQGRHERHRDERGEDQGDNGEEEDAEEGHSLASNGEKNLRDLLSRLANFSGVRRALDTASR